MEEYQKLCCTRRGPQIKCWSSIRQLCSCAAPPQGNFWSPILSLFLRSYQTLFRRLMHSFPNTTLQLHNRQTKGRVQPGCPPPALLPPLKETCTASLSSPCGLSAAGERCSHNRSKMTMKLAYWDIRGVSLFADRQQLKVKEAADMFGQLRVQRCRPEFSDRFETKSAKNSQILQILAAFGQHHRRKAVQMNAVKGIFGAYCSKC